MTAQLDTRLLRYRSKPGSEDAVRLAQDLLNEDRASEAAEVTAAGLRQSPDDLALLLLDGRAHLSDGDLLRAQAALLKAARLAPAQKDPFRWLGEVLLKRGDPARALKVLERAASIDGNDRVVATLRDRAERLARIADTDGEAAAANASRAAFDAPQSDETEARTVVRPDLSSALAAGTAPAPVWDDEDGETRARAGGSDEDETTSPHVDDDAETTSLMDRASLGALGRSIDAKRGVAAAKPAPLASAAPVVRAAPVAKPAPSIPTASIPTASIPTASLPTASLPTAGIPAPSLPTAGIPAPSIRTASIPGAGIPAAAVARSSSSANPARTPLKARKATLAFGAAAAPSVPPAHRPAAPAAPLSPRSERLGAPDPFADAPPPPPPPIGGAPDPFADAPAAPPAAAPPPPAPARLKADPFAPVDPFDDPPVQAPYPSAPPAALPQPAPLPSGAILSPLAPPPAVDESAPFELDSGAIADAQLLDVEGAAGPPPPDVPHGDRAGQTEDVDEVLSVLERDGIFERPGEGQAGAWTAYKDARPERTRIGVVLGVAWVLVIGGAVGGWFGWQAWVEARHTEAERLVAQAREEALAGDHERLVDAERHLRAARELFAADVNNPTVLLMVHCQRALEDGEFEAGYLRPTLARAERIGADEAWLHAARAVLAASESDRDEALGEIAQALETGGDDAGILYVAGRIEQRYGIESALEHLESATRREPALAAAATALAEARFDDGRPEDALTLLNGILEHDDHNLRAELWRRFLTADEGEPAEGMSGLESLHDRIEEHGAATDEVLYQLTRARFLRRQGEQDQAGDAVEAALSTGAEEPRLLALMAQAARGAGRLVQAEYAANAAVRGSPGNTDFRKLLALIYLDRRNGERALATLAEMPANDPDVLAMSARAALLVDTNASIAGAIEAVDAYITEHEDAGLELRTLRVRLGAAAGDAAGALAAAQTLSRDYPGDPTVALALGEAALAASDPATAVRALELVTRASPDDADAHWMLGRARRMSGSGDDARTSFDRAIELNPQHAEARIALGGLLLDLGDYEAADTLYTELGRTGGSSLGMPLTVAGRLGRVEALIGLGRLDDAQVQLEGVTGDIRGSYPARMTAARLGLARNRPGDALRELGPLLEGERVSPTVRSMQGDGLLGAGEVDAAAEAYEAALRDDSGLPEALLGRAELLVRAEHARDARPLLERAQRALAQRIRPPSFRARRLYLEGRGAFTERDLDIARAKLREATAIAGCPPEAFFFLGEALAGDNAPEATAAYARYLVLAPDGSYASRARRATTGR